jgi:phytoene dehydrogenase-like protein
METYDAVIIGGGHNGLILGNYLVRAGLKTLILERRLEVGGALSTEEITVPGFYHNIHSYFHDTINVMPAFQDLELEKYNACYRRPEVQAAIALQDGRSISIHTDVEKTCASIARISRHDAEAYREMYENYESFMEVVVLSALYSRAQPPSTQQVLLESSPDGLELLRMGRLSPRDVLDDYFENDHVKSLILHQLPIPRGILPDYDGLGTIIPLLVSQVEHSQICIGGSHVLAHALWRSFFAHGGISLGHGHVAEIVVKNGRATGVTLDDGRQFGAKKLVASAVDLKQTFLNLVSPEHLGEGFVKQIKRFKLDEFSIFGVHLALNEPPRHTSSQFDPDIDRAFKLNIGLERPNDFSKTFSDIRQGKLPQEPGLFCSSPTLFDSNQAPPGKHTALIWQPVPYAPTEAGNGGWNEIKNDFMEQCIAGWRKYAPNLDDRNIIAKTAVTPLDIEQKLINMRAGGVFMGRIMQGQLEYFRPTPELSNCRTPIEGLYLCGSCCHPGGGITGAPGLIAAEVIAEDNDLTKWWEM